MLSRKFGNNGSNEGMCTFTGVAFTHSGKVQGNDVSKIAESLDVIKWPGSNLSHSDKIPSIISYSKNPPVWGGSIRDRDDMQIAHFKLGLQPDSARHYGRVSHDGSSGLAFLQPNYRHPKMPGKTAVDFAAGYLKCILTERRLRDAIRYFESAFKRDFNPYDVDANDRDYELPMGGLEQVGIDDDYLKLTKYIPVSQGLLTVGMNFRASLPQFLIRYTISSINKYWTCK
jgi:hypothetical protein